MGTLALQAAAHARAGTLVNDIHSQLNATRVAAIVTPRSVGELAATVARARRDGKSVSIAGGRHAMGGQQFGEASVLVDTRALDRVLAFDAERGLDHRRGRHPVARAPRLPGARAARRAHRTPKIREIRVPLRDPRNPRWGIVQKQTGADRLSLGGALSCNAHGRGLALKPIVDQVESFDLLDAGRRRPHLLAPREPGACSGWRSAATACSASSRACSCGCARASRCSASSRSATTADIMRALRAADPRRLPLRRLPVRHRRHARQLPAPRRVLLLPARRSGDAAHRESDPLPPRRLGAADALLAHEQAPGLRVLHARATSRRPARSTGPTRSSRPPTSTTTTPTSTAPPARASRARR